MSDIQRGERYVIIDNFLNAITFGMLREYAEHADFQTVDSVVDARIDGAALRSRGGLMQFADKLPVGGGLADCLSAVKKALLDHPEIFGGAPDSSQVISFALWKYPAGTRLGWHNDAGNDRTGEYILYIHEEWHPSWGGELIILDQVDPTPIESLPNSARSIAIEAAVANSNATFSAIQPRPNRLVMVPAGTWHYINRVDKAAGTAERCSLTGFVSRPTRRAENITRLSQLHAVLGWSDSNATTVARPRE